MLKWISRLARGLIGVVVLAVALGVFALLTSTRADPARRGGAERPLVVNAFVASQREIDRVYDGYGTARAMNTADVSAEVAARVISRPASVEAGEPIEAGATIIELDVGDFEARASSLRRSIEATSAELDGLEVDEANLRDQVEAATDELRVAERELERARQAEEQGALNQSETDQRLLAVRQSERFLASLRNQLELVPSRRATLQATLEARRADLIEAERNIARTTIVSPIDGYLQRVAVEAGEYVRVGDPVARVVDLSVIEVPIRLPVSASGRVRRGDAVELRPEADRDTVWTGRVARVSPEADERSRSVEVFVEVRQDPDSPSVTPLLPGRFLTARVNVGSTEQRIVMPRRVVDDGSILIGVAIDVESEIEVELARFDERLAAMPEEQAATLVSAGAEERRAWLLENDPRIKRLAASKRPTRVREAEVIVDRYVDGTLPEVVTGETQWAVLASSGAGPRGLEPGQFVLLSNLDQLRVGMEIDLRLPGEESDGGAATADSGATAAEG